MIIKYKTNLERREMAIFLSYCMGDDFIPYMPNDGDNLFWTVDRGNDWKVKFFDEKPNEMEVVHRYKNKEAIQALATWVAYRTGGSLDSGETK